MITAAELIAFEDRIRAHWRAGELPCLLHLCGGNESQLLRAMQDYDPAQDWILSGHRNHYHALIAGIPPAELEASILAGRSMFTASKAHRMLSSAILAGLAGVANGIAWAMREDRRNDACVWCFVGDGAEEEGHFYEAAMFAETHRLNVQFVIEDNNRQVDTTMEERRPRRVETMEFIFTHSVSRYFYNPTYPHAGDGSQPGAITFKPEAIDRLRKLTSGV